jgi:hypothetical protein
MKKFKNVTIVIIVVILVFVSIPFVLRYIGEDIFKLNSNDKEAQDYLRAKNIRYGLLNYLEDSGDWDLSFGEEKTEDITVSKIIIHLQQKIIYNGKEYGPYFKPGPDYEPNPMVYYLRWTEEVGGKHNGWEIIIKRGIKDVEVKPSQSGDKVLIID